MYIVLPIFFIIVKAFKSTLDEVVYADILLIVSDITDKEVSEHIKVTESVIEELGAVNKPIIYVYNKCDLIDDSSLCVDGGSSVAVSGATGKGIDTLVAKIEEIIHKFKKKYKLLIPYSEQSILSSLYDNYTVLNVEYLDDNIGAEVVFDERARGIYSKYITEN